MAKHKSRDDKQLKNFFEETVTKNMMHLADEKYKELTQYGERSLTVFRRVPYQMVDMGDSFYFVEIPGFVSDDPDALDLNAVYDFEKLRENKPRHKKQFTIRKRDIVEAEIGGRYSGYFNRLCGYLTLSYRKGARLKCLAFYLPGENNQFAVKNFLDGIEVTIHASEKLCKGRKGLLLDKNEETVMGALLKFFNHKGRMLNIMNWLLAAVSVLLVVWSAVFDFPQENVMMGVAALLPLAVYLNYIRYNGLLGLLLTGLKRETVYHKSKPACFGKIVVPSVALLMSEIVRFSELASFRQYVILGFGIGLVLAGLYDTFVPLVAGKEWLRRGLVCGAMCIFYAFMAVIPVNRLSVTTIDSRVMDYPASFGHEERSRGETFHYCGVIMADGTYTFYISPQEYEKLERHELSAQVDECSGLLQLHYYEFHLVEASEEAKRHSAFLENLPKLPSNPTPGQLLEYQRQKQAILERLQELVSESNLLVSGTDLDGEEGASR